LDPGQVAFAAAHHANCSLYSASIVSVANFTLTNTPNNYYDRLAISTDGIILYALQI
jgi:hypothetical protein